jgi:trans-2,3-dihydro-3-hydroxyanthranilate isomerase
VTSMGPVELQFALVDVFGDAPLTGNPLAVVLGADALGDETLARIAREFNQSETTFVVRPRESGAARRLRSFTAAGIEVFGAGHNALGAWWWLAARGDLDLHEGTTTLVQEMGERCLPLNVSVADGRTRSVAMSQAPAVYWPPVEAHARLAGDLGLEIRDLDTGRVPAQVVSTGAAHLLLPVASAAALARIRPAADRLRATLATVAAQGCYAYTRDTGTADAVAVARFFNPTVGIWEDAATGSAAGPLVAQLVRAGLATPDVFHHIIQGQEMGRPSRLAVRSDGTAVTVAGAAVVVAEGILRL